MKTRFWACLALEAFICAGLLVSGRAQTATGGPINNGKAIKPRQSADLLESKVSPDLLSLYQCAQKRATGPAGQTCMLPPSGVVEVEIKLAAGSPELDQKLTTAGLKITSGAGTSLVRGEIAIEKLGSLAEVEEVSSVAKLQHQALRRSPFS